VIKLQGLEAVAGAEKPFSEPTSALAWQPQTQFSEAFAAVPWRLKSVANRKPCLTQHDGPPPVVTTCHQLCN